LLPPVQAQFQFIFNRISIPFAPVPVITGETITILGEVFIASRDNGYNKFFSLNVAEDGVGALTNLTLRQRQAQSLVDAINSNVNLNWSYNAILIAVTAQNFFGIIINAKYFGLAFSLRPATLTPTPAVGENVITTITGGGINRVMANFFNAFNQGADKDLGNLLQQWDFAVYLDIYLFTDPFQVPFTTNSVPEWGRLPNNPNEFRIASLQQPYQSNNEYVFDVAPYLKKYTFINFTFSYQTILAQPGVALVPNGIQSYFFRFGYQHSGGQIPNIGLPFPQFDPFQTWVTKYQVAQEGPHWFSPGAYDLNMNTTVHSPFWFQSQLSGGTNVYFLIKLLTKQPAFKLRRRKDTVELVYFYYLNDQQFAGTNSIRLKNVYTYTDGTTLTQFTHLTNNVSISGLYFFDTSMTKLNFNGADVNATKRIRSSAHNLEIRRGGGGFGAYSLAINYEWDENTENLSKYNKIYFKSKLGIYEQFEFEGVINETIKTSDNPYEKSFTTRADRSYNRQSKINANITIDFTKFFTINTGLINKEHLDYLIELIISNDAFFLLDRYNQQLLLGTTITNSQVVPIIISDYKYDKSSLQSYTNLELTFSVAIPENTIKS